MAGCWSLSTLAQRYERHSVLVSSNPVISQWDQIFKDPMTTLTTMTAEGRLVRHDILLGFNGERLRVPREKETGGG